MPVLSHPISGVPSYMYVLTICLHACLFFWITHAIGFGRVQVNQEMVRASDGIVERHHWDSLWWEWIFNLRGILYYSVDAGYTYTESVYMLGKCRIACMWGDRPKQQPLTSNPHLHLLHAGNPLVIWLVFGAVVISAVVLLLFLRYRQEPAAGLELKFEPFFCAIAFCLCGYACNLLPYLAVSRSCFIYHYMPALMYGQIAAGLLLEQVVPRKWHLPVAKWALLIIFAGFLFFCPWIYAMPLTTEGHERRRWLPRWN